MSAPALIMAVILLSHYQLSMTMVMGWWQNDPLNQGLLILPACGWLFFTNRQGVKHTAPWWPGLLLFVLSSVLILVGELTHAQAIAEIGLLSALLLVPITFYGWQFLRSYWFVFAFALFAFPIWSVITPYAQLLTTHASVLLLGLSSLPIYAEGFSIEIPAGTFLVEEGCSGMRYLISALAIGSLYVHLSSGRWGVKLGMFLLLAALAIFGNWIRILLVIGVANFWGITHPMVDDHATMGWIIFAILLLGWFWLGNQVLQNVTATNHRRVNLSRLISGDKLTVTTLLLLVVTIALPTASNKILAAPKFRPIETDNLLPSTWQQVTNNEGLAPHFPGATKLQYTNENSPTTIYLMLYQQQTDGAELINEANSNFDSKRWELIEKSSSTQSLASANPSTASPITDNLEVNEQIIKDRSDQRYLLWSWYEFGQQRTITSLTGKIYGLSSKLNQKNGSLAVMFSTKITDSTSTSRDQLLHDLELTWPNLEVALHKALAR